MRSEQPIDIPGLLAWFRLHAKIYPWAVRPTPYRVWISEIMLQQTVISTVLPYFRKWMRQFPSIRKLAQAGEELLLRAWEGLGYYSRVRNIGKTARIVDSVYRGRLPADYASLCRLPGIGAYTAGAIMSIAYNRPYPVLDANVMRIMQRLLAIPVPGRAQRDLINSLLQQTIPANAPGAFNQALMQLGQLVCKRDIPCCPVCPLKKNCLACSQDIQATIPVRKKQTIQPRESQVLIFYASNECYVITREQGLFKGLRLFPGWPPEHLPRAIRQLLAGADSSVRLKPRNHFYTRYREHLVPILCLFTDKPDLQLSGGSWVPFRILSILPFPSVYRKIVEDVQAVITLQ